MVVFTFCFASCSSNDAEPEPVIQIPEKPEPESPAQDKGWVVDLQFSTPLKFVKHVERLTSGKLIVATDTQLTRVNADGSIDNGFPVIETDGFIQALALQDNGSILIGGFFKTVDGERSPYIARLNADGTLDAGFTNAHEIVPIEPYETFVNSIAIKPDGKIVAGGSFLSRFNVDGSIDASFNAPAELFTNNQVFTALEQDYITAMFVQPDGKIIVGGRGIGVKVTPYKKGIFTYSNVRTILRLNENGIVDESFKHTINLTSTKTLSPHHRLISSIIPLSDGSYIVGGRFNSTMGPTYYFPIGNDGDYTFVSNSGVYAESSGSPYTMLRLSDEEILIGRLKRNGVPSDMSCILTFNPELKGITPLFFYGKEGDPKVFSEAQDMVIESANSVIVAGWFVEELSTDYDYFSSNDVVTKTKGLLRMVKR